MTFCVGNLMLVLFHYAYSAEALTCLNHSASLTNSPFVTSLLW